MVVGIVTIVGTVMVLYANILASKIPDAMGHILTASVLNIFSSLIISMLIIPHQNSAHITSIKLPKLALSPMDAIVTGTSEGMKLLINIVALLIVLVALVSLVNQILQFLPTVNGQAITLQGILGLIMAPITFLIGIPIDEIITAGSLMDTIAFFDWINYSNISN